MRWIVFVALIGIAGLGSACVARASLHDVVLDYDEAVSRAQAEMILLNVARARYQRPVHFTTVSGIAATFDFRASAAIGGEIAESPGIGLLTPSLGASISENPTISIVPMQGEEFTRRLLAPLDESTPGFFYHQGIDPVLLLRLVARAVILERPDGGGRVVHSNPSREFDAVLARVGRAHVDGVLDMGPLVFDESWSIAAEHAPSPNELVELIAAGYDFAMDGERGRLSRRVVGRHAITEYDPAVRGNDERVAMQRLAQQYPSYFVLLDLPDRDGATAVRGWVKLRSVGAILDAVANAIDRADRRVPVRVSASIEPVAESLFAVRYEGSYYSLLPGRGDDSYRAFRVLCRLYQMAISELPIAAVPPVTIAK